MKKWFVASLFFISLTLFGCSDPNNGIVGEEPPKAVVEVGDNSYETTLGSYCWGGNGQSTCVETAGPKELLKGNEPIKVKPGKEIIL